MGTVSIGRTLTKISVRTACYTVCPPIVQKLFDWRSQRRLPRRCSRRAALRVGPSREGVHGRLAAKRQLVRSRTSLRDLGVTHALASGSGRIWTTRLSDGGVIRVPRGGAVRGSAARRGGPHGRSVSRLVRVRARGKGRAAGARPRGRSRLDGAGERTL